MAEATIRDVARRAEVSVASVSRALNGLDNVRADTRERVIAAADALGYVPHAGARSLSLARAHTIGVVLPDLHGEFFSEVMRSMDREATRRGYMLLLSNMHADGMQAAAALRAMRGRVDGLLVMAPHVSPAALERALPPTLPAVLINSPAELAAIPSLRLDNRAGAEAMVKHLADNGYRRIVHVAGPAGNIDADERADGYLRAMRLRLPDVEPEIVSGDFSEEAGEAAAMAFLASSSRPEALFAANDMMAIGCMQALKAAGLKVPQDVAVAGFDDVPIARYLGLTTVRVRAAEIGERAISILIDMLEGRGAGESRELFDPVLVARETTARRGSHG